MPRWKDLKRFCDVEGDIEETAAGVAGIFQQIKLRDHNTKDSKKH